MAIIKRHPQVEDYIVEIPIDDIRRRPEGVTPEYEASRVIIPTGYRVDVDRTTLDALAVTIDSIPDLVIRRKVKKLPLRVLMNSHTGASDDRVHAAMFQSLCHGDPELLDRVAAALRDVDRQINALFATCFPRYRPLQVFGSPRLTRSQYEGLHWDLQDGRSHKVRMFANLDQHLRMWYLSHNFIDFARERYAALQLDHFAGREPDEMRAFLVDHNGGQQTVSLCPMPAHALAFEPGEVWILESRFIAHEILYGERAIVYEFTVDPADMLDPEKCFFRQFDALHREAAV